MTSTKATKLGTLAGRLGIFDSYVDNAGVERTTSDETRRALLAALGHDASNDIAAARALRNLEEEESARVVEPACVMRAGEASPIAARSRAFGSGTLLYDVVAKAEDGTAEQVSKGRARVSADGTIAGVRAAALEPGTYRLALRLESPGVCRIVEQWVAVVPAACTSLEDVIGARRAYGIWSNLYSVRSRRGMGIGNLTDLAKLARFAGENGADFVGLNPLHALRNRGPEISPYGPVSRLFRNPLYLDVTKVPEFKASDEVRSRMNDDAFRRELERARASERVDYELIHRLQQPLLEALWRAFKEGRIPARDAACERYRERMGAPLADFATFCVIEERMAAEGVPRDWRLWPSDLRDPSSRAVAAVRQSDADRTDFHAWIQFEVDRQLAGAARACKRTGMQIGLYQDLAVGSLASSFDAWAFPGLFVEGAQLGAPPDAYSATGQDWGFPPIHPHRLRADQFRYWRLLLRAGMDHCGMLRLDHAMGVLRQFWIPAGRSGTEGTYVGFPAGDLLGLLALESRRRGAVVVAEDLGTVPKGFSALLARYGILSSQVMFFERTADNGFVRSRGYSNRALLTANTHDQATLAGWWTGRDIEIRRTVGMIASGEEMAAALAKRLRERESLVRRLRAEGVLESTKGVHGISDVTRAVYQYLSAAPSPLLGVSLDDLAFETEPVNVPGVSVQEFPSWSRRMRIELADLGRSEATRGVLCGLGKRARPRRTSAHRSRTDDRT